ncbi:MAG: hypothetical protein LBR57_02840 [Alistipes sp.]|jgi:hypothetical protein|nr:hypothetical protein [Alistipes sp.]
MKKLVTLACVALSAALSALSTGCKPEPRYDYFNTDITIFVRDKKGVNLCSPRLAGADAHILYDNVWIEYNGWKYPLAYTGLPGDTPNTRATEVVKPQWTENGREPLRWNHLMDDSACLMFGEFSIDTKEYRGETFTIHWGDGTRSEVKFDLYPEGSEPSVRQATWLKDKSGEWLLSSESSLFVTVVR